MRVVRISLDSNNENIAFWHPLPKRYRVQFQAHDHNIPLRFQIRIDVSHIGNQDWKEQGCIWNRPLTSTTKPVRRLINPSSPSRSLLTPIAPIVHQIDCMYSPMFARTCALGGSRGYSELPLKPHARAREIRRTAEVLARIQQATFMEGIQVEGSP